MGVIEEGYGQGVSPGSLTEPLRRKPETSTSSLPPAGGKWSIKAG